MATYPIKMLRDEDRQPFVPFTNAAAVVDKDNNSLQELMDNGKYKIQNNVTTSSAGKGVLDAYQGKVLNDKFNSYVPLSQKGVANGVASLDSEGKVPSGQLPSYVDDVIESYIVSGSTALSAGWLSKTDGGTALTPEKGKIYLIMTSGSYQNKQYRWGGSTYVLCNPSDVNSVNGMTGVVTLKKLTIQKNGTQVGDTFNGTTDEVINITVPTNNNQLTNGAGYITSAGSITGNAATATKATQDGNGNVIVDTYVKKAGDIMTGGLIVPTLSVSELHRFTTQNGGGSSDLVLTVNDTSYVVFEYNTDEKSMRPSNTTKGLVNLGTSANKWNNVYANKFIGPLTGNVTGDVTGTASNASKTTGTLTIQKNGTNIDTFNGSANKTINIEVPTTTPNVTADSTQALTSGGAYSKLTRRLKTTMVDLGFTENAYVDAYDFFKAVHSKMGAGDYILEINWSNANAAYITDGTNTIYINGGNMLCSISGNPTSGTWVSCTAHYTSNAAFNNLSAVISGTIDSNAGTMAGKKVTVLAQNSAIPTKVSQLTNDSNYITKTDYASASTAGVVKLGTGLAIADGILSVTGAATADSVEWSVVKNRPTAVSYWTNDAGYIKASNTMTGATATTAGAAGTVPAPAAGKEAQFLRGDGTWAVPSYATSAGSATQDGKGQTIATTYLPLSGGIMTGAIKMATTNYTSTPIQVKDDGTTYGHTLLVSGGGTTFVGAGESAGNLSTALGTITAENLYLTADSQIYFYSGCDTISERIGMTLSGVGNLYPTANNSQTLGTSSMKWKTVYATTFNGQATNVLVDDGSTDNERKMVVCSGASSPEQNLYTVPGVTGNYATGRLSAKILRATDTNADGEQIVIDTTSNEASVYLYRHNADTNISWKLANVAGTYILKSKKVTDTAFKNRTELDGEGAWFRPGVTNTTSLGTSTLRWKGLYTTTANLSGHLYLEGVADSVASSTSKIVFGDSSTNYGYISGNTSDGVFFGDMGDAGKCMGYDGSANAFRPQGSNKTAALGTTDHRWVEGHIDVINMSNTATMSYNAADQCIDFIFK